jgi:hypothetical protein
MAPGLRRERKAFWSIGHPLGWGRAFAVGSGTGRLAAGRLLDGESPAGRKAAVVWRYGRIGLNSRIQEDIA